MKLLPALPFGPRLGGLLLLLLLSLLGLGTALSMQQSRQQLAHLAWMETTALPSARLLHELSAHVDELRGLLALHLMLGGSAEAGALEQQMQQRREAVSRRLAGFGPGVTDATERRHFEDASASLAQFVAAHDRLLALSRQGQRDPAAATAARQLLTGPAQLAYQRLSADLAAWSAYVEQRTDQAQRQARAGLAAGPWLLAAQAGVVLAAMLLAALLLTGRLGPLPLAAAATANRRAALWADGPRFDAHLQAVNAAVAAARDGAPAADAPVAPVALPVAAAAAAAAAAVAPAVPAA